MISFASRRLIILPVFQFTSATQNIITVVNFNKYGDAQLPDWFPEKKTAAGLNERKGCENKMKAKNQEHCRTTAWALYINKSTDLYKMDGS